MRKFLVNVIGHQLKGKVVAPFGTEVDESQLMGNADALVDAGFLKEVKSDKKEDNPIIEADVNDINVEDAKEVKSDKKK